MHKDCLLLSSHLICSPGLGCLMHIQNSSETPRPSMNITVAALSRSTAVHSKPPEAIYEIVYHDYTVVVWTYRKQRSGLPVCYLLSKCLKRLPSIHRYQVFCGSLCPAGCTCALWQDSLFSSSGFRQATEQLQSLGRNQGYPSSRSLGRPSLDDDSWGGDPCSRFRGT